MAETDNNKLFLPTTQFSQGRAQYSIVNDIWGGTEAMRAARETYLPRFPAETVPNYNTRLKGGVLINIYKRTVQTNVGRVFSKPVVLEEDDNDKDLIEFSKNVDGSGQTLTEFSKNAFTADVNHGATYILIDFPRVEGEINLLQARDLGLRPFWVNIRAPQVLEVGFQVVGGIRHLTYFRYMENVPKNLSPHGTTLTSTQIAPIGASNASFSMGAATAQFSMGETQERVKIFKMDPTTRVVTFEVWQKNAAGVAEQVETTVELTGVDRIPIVCAYSNRVDFFYGLPTLMDLAESQVSHWQSYSDQANILRIIRVPMLQVKGFEAPLDAEEKDTQIIISPNTAIPFPPTPDTGAEWIEHKGDSVSAGREWLKDLEGHMSMMGLELHVPRATGPESATGRLIDESASTSLLKEITVAFFDAIEEALNITLAYMGKTDVEVGTINANLEVESPFRGIEDLISLIELFKSGAISVETLMKEAMRRNVLSSDTDVEEELNKLSQNRPDPVEDPTPNPEEFE